jgi:hypothetical protein
LKKEVELTYQRGKAYSNESLLVRQQLELKIQTLCKKILKKNSINIIRSVKNKTFRGLWNKTSGELFTCFDQETENKQILWDEENFTEKALTVLRDLQTADREKKNLFISISNLTNSTNCLLMANQSLTKEREKYLDVIEKVREEITSSEIELNEVQKNLKIVQKKVEVFQSGTGIESLNSKELADFESTLINRIKDIRAEKAKRRFQQEFEVIKRKLETYVDSEVLDDLEC